MSSSQHRSRRLALQGLCCLDTQGMAAMPLVEHFIRDSHEAAGIVKRAIELINEVMTDRDGCDALLVRHARHWDLSRLALVDRNILRLGAHELRLGTLPYKIVISEAIRLAKEFSTAESPRFVNGVLDAVAREVCEVEPETAKEEIEQ